VDANEILRKLVEYFCDWPIDVIGDGDNYRAYCPWCTLHTDAIGFWRAVMGNVTLHDQDCAWRQGMELRDKPKPACEGCKWWLWDSVNMTTGECERSGSLDGTPNCKDAQIWAVGWATGAPTLGVVESIATAFCAQFEPAE